MKKIFPAVSALALMALPCLMMAGCYYDKEELLYRKPIAADCTTVSAKFSTDILPLIKSNCATAGCHDAGGSAGGIVLENYTQISGAAVRINQRCIIDKTMPPGGPLTTADIAALTCWLNSGAPNN